MSLTHECPLWEGKHYHAHLISKESEKQSLRSPCSSCSEGEDSQTHWPLPVDLSTLQLPWRASKQNQIKQIPAEMPFLQQWERHPVHTSCSPCLYEGKQTLSPWLWSMLMRRTKYYSATGKVLSPPGMKAVRKADSLQVHNPESDSLGFPCLLYKCKVWNGSIKGKLNHTNKIPWLSTLLVNARG